MLAHFTKPILELLPEAKDLIKQANLEASLPTDSRDSTIASALAITYASQISGQSLDVDQLTKVASSITLYDLQATLAPLRQNLVKRAMEKKIQACTDPKTEYLRKEASFVNQAILQSPGEKAKCAAQLVKQASISGTEPTEIVQRYSGNLSMSKKASIESLAARFQRTGTVGFAKLACAIGAFPDGLIKAATAKDICETVTQMDLDHGLHFQGFDFYRETLLTKEAAASALTVKLCNKDVPYESIAKAGRARVAQYIGEDVAKEMDAGPENAKAVFETLPADLQNLLLNVVNNA